MMGVGAKRVLGLYRSCAPRHRWSGSDRVQHLHRGEHEFAGPQLPWLSARQYAIFFFGDHSSCRAPRSCKLLINVGKVSNNQAMGLLALAVLAVLLLAPSASFHMFSGLPLASLPEYLGLLALLPVIVWPWLRHRWRTWVAACPAGWLRLVVAALCAGVLLKGALFVAGGYEGFAGCYQAIYRTVDHIAARPDDGRTGLCEKSYDNPLARFSSTRIDSVLDFGPDDWNLSFMNDNRFNFYRWRSGAILRERLPFSVTWRGLTSHPSPQNVTLTYVGHVQIGLIGRGVLSFDPAYGAPRTAEFRLPAGRQLVFIKYAFDDGYRKGMASPPRPRRHVPVANRGGRRGA